MSLGLATIEAYCSKLLFWDHCLEFNCPSDRGNRDNFTKNLMVELDWEIVEIQNCMLSRVEWDWIRS
jgi:hypothetical protein